MTFSISKDTSNTVKFFAALLVMFHHYSQYVIANGISSSLFFKILSSQGGFIGVAIFFFLSGYGLMESEQKSHLNLKNFFKRRFLKVYLPVLLVTFIWMLICTFIIPLSSFEEYEFQMGGGKWLIFNNLFIDFGDVVLWFVKVLFFLYAVFYTFSYIYLRHHSLGLLFLVTLTGLTTYIIANYLAAFKSISIPYFTLGILMSIFKESKYTILISELFLVCFGILGFIVYNESNSIHSFLNAVFVGAFILFFSVKKWRIRIPAILGLVSFDLYLVHNKILQALKFYFDEVSLWVFLLMTILSTLVFYMLRSKIFKI